MMLHRLLAFAAFALTLTGAPALAQEASPSHYFVPIESRAALSLVQEAGFKVQWRSSAGVWLKLSEREVARAVSLGFAPRYWPRSPALPSATARKANTYHDNDGVKTVLDQIAAGYPAIAKRFTLGQSVQGRDLHGLVISKNPTQEWGVPQIRLVGSHHGDEYMSVEIPLLMAQYLTSQYATNSRVKALVDSTYFVVVPLVNPDGHELEQRENANCIDLNRDYGYEYQNDENDECSGGIVGHSQSAFSQPEVRAVADDHFARHYTISYSFHTFGDVVNYLFNYTTLTYPDEPQIKAMSDDYAANNGYKSINGRDWYQTYGDLNDFSYGTSGDFDWTIELIAEDPHNPFAAADQTISAVWNENREALLDAFEQVQKGLSGVVRDRQTGNPLRAYVLCDELFWPVYSGRTDGYFKRLMLPGDYTCKVVAPGYDTASLGKRTITDSSPLFVGDVLLSPTPGQHVYAFQAVAVSTKDGNKTYSPALLGAPDGKGYSLYRQGGFAVLDMGLSMALDADHALRVTVTAATSGTRYVAYVGNDYSGPWVSLGEAVGTNDFSLHGLAMTKARYVKVVASTSADSYPAIDAVEYRSLAPAVDGDTDLEAEKEAEAVPEGDAEAEAESDSESETRADGDLDAEAKAEAEQEHAEGQGETEIQEPDGDSEKALDERDTDLVEADGEREVVPPHETGSGGGCSSGTPTPFGLALLLAFAACRRLKRRLT